MTDPISIKDLDSRLNATKIVVYYRVLQISVAVVIVSVVNFSVVYISFAVSSVMERILYYTQCKEILVIDNGEFATFVR